MLESLGLHMRPLVVAELNLRPEKSNQNRATLTTTKRFSYPDDEVAHYASSTEAKQACELARTTLKKRFDELNTTAIRHGLTLPPSNRVRVGSITTG